VKKMLFLFIVTTLFGATFDWIDNLKKAKELSAENKKLIMVMIDQKGCEACEYMDEVAFEDETLSEFVENFFIPVKIDINRAKEDGFKVFGTPTFYFLDQKGKIIKRPLVGAATAEVFLEKLKEYKKLSNQ